MLARRYEFYVRRYGFNVLLANIISHSFAEFFFYYMDKKITIKVKTALFNKKFETRVRKV